MNITICCSKPHCDTSRRNNYFQGKRLSPASFQCEQAYSLQRRRLINQTIHGKGIVAGLMVSQQGKLLISSGLALDSYGRELIQPDGYEISLASLIVLDREGRPVKTQTLPELEGEWRLSIHYAEEMMGPVVVPDACACDQRQWDYLCETVRYVIQPWESDKPDQLECACDPRHPENSSASPRGGCCLDQTISNHQVSQPGKLSRIDTDCRSALVDLNVGSGVTLAKIRLRAEGSAQCPILQVISVETCGLRPLVKSNPLLFDLLCGRDLTTIASTSWEGWEHDTSFATFRDAFPQGSTTPQTVTHFEVRFTKPVFMATLPPDALAITALFREGEGGWWESLRVPITKLEALEPEGPLAIGFKATVPTRWVQDAIYGFNRFERYEARIEIEVRGDLIRDCNGQAIDANHNGTPGGTRLNIFVILPSQG